MKKNNEHTNAILKLALMEDLNSAGDITTRAIFDAGDECVAEIRSKQEGVLSGVTLVKPLIDLAQKYMRISLSYDDIVITDVTQFANDGDRLERGTLICKLHGSVHTILAAERTILNLLQRLSGIATATSKLVDIVKSVNAHTRILDTRKTAPSLRALEKRAVVHGGGVNHRIGLYDMILIKDTHVKRAGGAKLALQKALNSRGEKSEPQIEVEVQNVYEFKEVLPLNPNRIMLDNMSVDDIKLCVDFRNEQKSKVEIEASGNVSIETIGALAETGVDFISSGAITHSVEVVDIHLVVV